MPPEYYLDKVCALAKTISQIANTGAPDPIETKGKTALFEHIFPFAYRMGTGVFSADFMKNGKQIDLLDHIGNYAYIRSDGFASVEETEMRAGCSPDIFILWPVVLACWTNGLDVSKVEYWVTNALLQVSFVRINGLTIDPFEGLRLERDLVTPDGERFPNLKERTLVRYEISIRERRTLVPGDCGPLDFCKEERQCC